MNFSRVINVGDRLVGDGQPVLFVAEIGANFDNSLQKAKDLCYAAKASGAEVAKFQTFSACKIVSAQGFASMKLKGIHGSWGRPVDQVFKEAEFPRDWHESVAEYCQSIGIMFSSAPYDYEAVNLLKDLQVPFIKIGSGDITWHAVLQYIARLNVPIMLGTGASTLAEVSEAVSVLAESHVRDLIVMQCITNYPSRFESANINVLKTYQTAFNIVTGYSDHTPGDLVPLGAVALGAKVIEKHFTLDRSAKGPDHPHSMEPSEFKSMVEKTRQLELALGSAIKKVEPEESETVIVQRRSLYINRTIKKDEIIRNEDILELRPALGIPPKFRSEVAGTRARHDLKADQPLSWTDIG